MEGVGWEGGLEMGVVWGGEGEGLRGDEMEKREMGLVE